MALLKPDVEFKVDGFARLLLQMPDLSGGFLAFVGKRARTILKENYLSGQELNVPGEKDKKGRYLIVSNVNKARTQTKISSYPVNLFEHGRTLRDGSREKGKKIITKGLKNDLNARMQGYASSYEKRFMNKMISKAGLK